MENNKKKVGGGSSSSRTNFDHLFGPKDPSTTSSSSTSIFGSIFPPPSTVGGRDSTKQDIGYKNYGAPGNMWLFQSNFNVWAYFVKLQLDSFQAITVTKVKAAVSPTRILVPIIRMRQWSPATTVHQSIMVVKKIIPQEPAPLNPTILLRKIRMMMIQMVMIQTVLQEGTGGKVLFIISICPSMQARGPVDQDDRIDHVRCTQ
ncbi:hypothetical protein E2542_SST29545 [Spatholobus suberectus]|nr:hypothetical protein E2542_SST29545 [Spatholobus suberectus]